MRMLTRRVFAFAVAVATCAAAAIVFGAKPLPGPGSNPHPYHGPGDTVPPFSGTPQCPQLCPTTFSKRGCQVVCDFPMREINTEHNVASLCFPSFNGFEMRQFVLFYSDWLLLDSMIQMGAIVPDSDGNVTICTPGDPDISNIQEVRIREGQRINGGSPTVQCLNGAFPKVDAQVWILDGVHGGPPPHIIPADCDKEWLNEPGGVFGSGQPGDPLSEIVHCLAPPPPCDHAQVWITFNVDCMRLAIVWWAAFFGDNCLFSSSNPFALQCNSPLFVVGMLTCTHSE